MTMREEFDAWWAKYSAAHSNPFYRGAAEQAWQAAYRAGQEAMRERVAVLCIESMKPYRSGSTHLGLGDIRLTIGAQEEIAAAIRALPIDDQP